MSPVTTVVKVETSPYRVAHAAFEQAHARSSSLAAVLHELGGMSAAADGDREIERGSPDFWFGIEEIMGQIAQDIAAMNESNTTVSNIAYAALEEADARDRKGRHAMKAVTAIEAPVPTVATPTESSPEKQIPSWLCVIRHAFDQLEKVDGRSGDGRLEDADALSELAKELGHRAERVQASADLLYLAIAARATGGCAMSALALRGIPTRHVQSAARRYARDGVQLGSADESRDARVWRLVEQLAPKEYEQFNVVLETVPDWPTRNAIEDHVITLMNAFADAGFVYGRDIGLATKG